MCYVHQSRCDCQNRLIISLYTNTPISSWNCIATGVFSRSNFCLILYSTKLDFDQMKVILWSENLLVVSKTELLLNFYNHIKDLLHSMDGQKFGKFVLWHVKCLWLDCHFMFYSIPFTWLLCIFWTEVCRDHLSILGTPTGFGLAIEIFMIASLAFTSILIQLE